MSDNHEKQIFDLQKELAEAKTENEALRDKVVAEKQAEFQTKVEALEAKISEKTEANKTLASNLEEKEAQITEYSEKVEALKKDKEEKEEELAVMKKKEAMMKRKAQLSGIGFSDEDCEATIATFEDVSEEIFENIVATMKKKAEMPDFIKKKMEEKKEDDKEDKSKASDDDVENLDLEAESDENAAASLQNLDNQEDEADALRAYASNWFEKSVLKSTQNLKEGE